MKNALEGGFYQSFKRLCQATAAQAGTSLFTGVSGLRLESTLRPSPHLGTLTSSIGQSRKLVYTYNYLVDVAH